MRDPNQVVTVHKDGRVSVKTVNKEPSMAQQQFKDECDINNIMKKYHQTGEIYHRNLAQGVYADMSEVTDYRTMLETVQRANDSFMSLPAEIRKKFNNDPQEMIDFLGDPKNDPEAVKLGLRTMSPQIMEQIQNEQNEQIQTNDKNKTKKTSKQSGDDT